LKMNDKDYNEQIDDELSMRFPPSRSTSRNQGRGRKEIT
jgi:hypothetical protein